MKIRQAVMVLGLVLAFAASTAPVQAARLADGTMVRVRLTSDLLSSHAVVGARVDLETVQPLMLQGVVAIPAGSVAWGAVQLVKSGKTLHFDIEGVRLPNQQIAKLRCSPRRTNSAAKDEIKVETQARGDLGALKGTEFTAYLDQDLEVPGVPATAPASPAVTAVAPRPATPEPAAVTVPAAAVVPPAPKPVAPASPPTPRAASPPVSVPTAPASVPAASATAVATQPVEYITVECFSEPSGADILIDDEFHGSTPSILKLVPGNHQIEFRLIGYKAHAQRLNLTPEMGLQTLRITLEKQP
jgi:hypothetical protein